MRGAWSLMMDEMVEKKEGGSNDIHPTLIMDGYEAVFASSDRMRMSMT